MRKESLSTFTLLYRVFWTAFAVVALCLFMWQTTGMLQAMRQFRFNYSSHNSITAGCVNFPPGAAWWDIADKSQGSAVED
jgi:hypothetical protein